MREIITIMILKTIGFYSLSLSILAVLLFAFVMLGDRSIYFIVISIAIVGLIVSICGLVFDKNKIYSLISIILFLIPPIIHWFLQE